MYRLVQGWGTCGKDGKHWLQLGLAPASMNMDRGCCSPATSGLQQLVTASCTQLVLISLDSENKQKCCMPE